MSTKSGLKTCFAFEHNASKAKHFKSVLRHVLRPDFVDSLHSEAENSTILDKTTLSAYARLDPPFKILASSPKRSK